MSTPRAVLVAAWAASAPCAAGADGGREPPAEAVLAELPFLEDRDEDAIWIDLAPETSRRRLPLLLDTGASEGYLTPRMARSLGVSVRRTKSTPYRRATVLGRDFQFRVDALRSDTGGRTSRELGLIGGDFLAAYVLEIDYPQRRVRFLDPRRFELPAEPVEGEAILPLRLVGNRPHLELDVAGERVSVLLDTGAEPGLVLGGDVAERAGLPSFSVPRLRLYGVLGEIAVRVAELDGLALGARALPRLPALVLPHGAYQMGDASDSALGHAVLSQFRIRIDYPRRRVGFSGGEGFRARFLGDDWEAVRERVLSEGASPAD